MLVGRPRMQALRCRQTIDHKSLYEGLKRGNEQNKNRVSILHTKGYYKVHRYYFTEMTTEEQPNRSAGSIGIATGRWIVLPMVTKPLPSLGAPDDDGYLPTRRWWMGDSLRCFKSLCMSRVAIQYTPMLMTQPHSLWGPPVR